MIIVFGVLHRYDLIFGLFFRLIFSLSWLAWSIHVRSGLFMKNSLFVTGPDPCSCSPCSFCSCIGVERIWSKKVSVARATTGSCIITLHNPPTQSLQFHCCGINWIPAAIVRWGQCIHPRSETSSSCIVTDLPLSNNRSFRSTTSYRYNGWQTNIK